MANLIPEECRPHCDVLFEGEAEYTWPRFLKEHAVGRHADHYHEPEKIHLPDSPPPRLDVLRKSYGQGIVQCTRGCPFTCEFCDIIVMYGRKMRFKPIEQVLAEVTAWHAKGAGKVFFADDNFIGNRAYAKDLLRALIKWNARQRSAMSFYTQASVDMVRDEELLALMRDANFFAVFLGIETPRKSSLHEARKGQNEKLDLVEAVHKIQAHNLFISAGMIVGFDHDDVGIFEEQYEFLQEAQIPIVLVNALEAVPKTPLHARLKAEGRLVPITPADDAARYRSGVGWTNFRPKLITQPQLKAGLEWLFQKLYAPEAFAERLLGNLSRFKNVMFRPETLKPSYVAVLMRLIRYYGSKGPAARRFFWGTLWKALRQSPRTVGQVVIYLGMYMHFCELHREALNWDPWSSAAKANGRPRPVAPEPAVQAATEEELERELPKVGAS
jgi:radical SAM superfamily enzyme